MELERLLERGPCLSVAEAEEGLQHWGCLSLWARSPCLSHTPGLPARPVTPVCSLPSPGQSGPTRRVCPFPGAECGVGSKFPSQALPRMGHPNYLGIPLLSLADSPGVVGLSLRLVGPVRVADRAWSRAGWLWSSHLSGPASLECYVSTSSRNDPTGQPQSSLPFSSRTLRTRELKWLALDHTASERLSQASNPGWLRGLQSEPLRSLR